MNGTTINRASRLGQHAVRRGFTLLEIIVVVTIIALLATLIAPRLLGQIGKAKSSVAKAEVTEIAKQLRLYMVDMGLSKVPEDLELSVLTSGSNPTLKDSDLLDPWSRPYMIVIPGEVNKTEFDIVSFGADGEPGGEGEDQDVVNE